MLTPMADSARAKSSTPALSDTEMSACLIMVGKTGKEKET
jgi:hypothetical protein